VATVTSQLTRIHDVEGALTLVSVGGGAGAAANTDIFLQGAQSVGRRQSNVTLNGFWLSDGVTNNLSAAGTHVGAWIFVTHYGALTALQIWLGDTTANYDQHAFVMAEYPALGGWVRVWIEVARTPDATGGTGSAGTAVQHFACIVSLPTVGGNAANVIMDAIDSTTTGLLLTGTTGLWSDFTTADQNTTNQYGVIRSNGGVLYCYARLTLGSASSLVFNDSSFVIIFAQQSLVASTFMGITIDLQNASTNIDWSSGVIRSAGAKQGDLIVTGTSGDFDATGMTLSNLRAITLTSACSLLNSAIAGCDKLTQASAVISGCSFSGSTTVDGEAFLISNNPANISSCLFTFSDGHAIEITTAGTYTFSANRFTGFGLDTTNDAAVYNNSGGLVTLNITNGGDTPTVRNGAGASTTVNNAVNLTITVVDESGVAIQNAQTAIYRNSDSLELLNADTDVSGVATTSFNFTGDTAVTLRVRKTSAGVTRYFPNNSSATITSAGLTVTVTLIRDIIASP
jgi:hypothetical protein